MDISFPLVPSMVLNLSSAEILSRFIVTPVLCAYSSSSFVTLFPVNTILSGVNPARSAVYISPGDTASM